MSGQSSQVVTNINGSRSFKGLGQPTCFSQTWIELLKGFFKRFYFSLCLFYRIVAAYADEIPQASRPRTGINSI